MSKLPMLVLLFLISFSGMSAITEKDVKDFLKDLLKHTEKVIKDLEDMTKKTNNTEIIRMDKNGIESFTQSAQIMKLSGLRDKDLNNFLERFIQRLKLPEKEAMEVKNSLKQIADDINGEWQSYKFVYTKNVTNSSIFYTSVLAQHDKDQEKSNWIYTELNSHLNKSDIMIISKTKKVGNKIVEDVEVIRKPVNFTDVDVDLMMKFLDVASVQAFSNYLGVNNPDKNLVFLNES
jgi:hypothetical protein